jgi:thiol:disulfide interchange protein DsbA
MSLRRILALAITALGFIAPGALAQQQPFTMLSPAQPTDGSGKIEVIEFFSYACGHCYTLEPFLESWERKLPADVVFKRVPGVGSSAWTELGKIYYAFEAMGKLDTLHRKAFDAVHKENLNLANAKTRYEWIAKQGVDAAKFQEVEKSFSVQSKLKRAGQLMGSYKVDGVPMLVVNGKYVTSASHAGGATNVVPVLENLIAMARRDMGGAAPAAAKK